MKNRRTDASASSPPIQFNSILARRTAFRLKEFFFKNTYQPHALLLNFVHPGSHNDRKPKVTYRLMDTCSQHSTFLYIKQRYFLGASLKENFTQSRTSTRPVVHNSTTGVRTTHHSTRELSDTPECGCRWLTREITSRWRCQRNCRTDSH